jgi:hypothetical protein
MILKVSRKQKLMRSTSAADQRFIANHGSTLSVHTNHTSQNISQYQYRMGEILQKHFDLTKVKGNILS